MLKQLVDMNKDKYDFSYTKDQYYGVADMFALPVSLLATRRKNYVGSFPGLFLTILFFIVIISFVSY